MRWLPSWIVLYAVSATAAPQVEIKAQTQLTLGSVRLFGETGDTEVEVIGQLLDKLTGDGLASQQVMIRVGPASTRAWTQEDGRFRIRLRLVTDPGPQKVVLEFSGTGSLDRAEPVSIVTDPSRAIVTLAIRTEPALGGVNVIVTSTVDDQLARLPVELSVGPPAEPHLKVVQTIDSGTTFLLTRKAAGGPGARRIRAVFSGDTTKQPSSAEATIEISSQTTTTMKLATLELAYEDDLVVTGKVSDEDGRPVGRAAVTLTAGDRRLAQGATNGDGAYKFEVEAELLGQGTFGIVVESDPSSTFIRASKSTPAIIRIAPPQPVPVSYTIAAFLATAFAAGGFFAARAKPWRRFRRPAPPAEAPEKDADSDVVDGGLVVAKPGLVSTLRRPYDEGFSGVVRDTVRGRPVPEAVVRLVLDDAERELRTAADGSFTFERLGVGEWRADVAAPGHVTERFVVSIPHRGELRGVRVDLVPVRERVFQLYRRAAEPILPEPRLWGIWSPRQIVDHVRSQRPSPALAELTDFVEEVYFSARLAAESLLRQASEHVDRAIRERARAAG